MATSTIRQLSALATCSLLSAGCASTRLPDLEAAERVIEVERFMGDWYVLSFIPIDLPFFSEAGAHDAVETYELTADGEIAVRYTFLDGSFDVEPTVMTQRAWVHDEERGTEWRVQFLWPLRSAYLIAWVNDSYTRAIIGVPSRSNVWLLSRDAAIPDSELADLTKRIEALGYETGLLRRVPHRGVAEGPS